MRGTRAKRERRADPSRPNPGRLGGGSGKVAVREAARPTPEKWWRSITTRGYKVGKRIGKERVVGRYAKR